MTQPTQTMAAKCPGGVVSILDMTHRVRHCGGAWELCDHASDLRGGAVTGVRPPSEQSPELARIGSPEHQAWSEQVRAAHKRPKAELAREVRRTWIDGFAPPERWTKDELVSYLFPLPLARLDPAIDGRREPAPLASTDLQSQGSQPCDNCADGYHEDCQDPAETRQTRETGAHLLAHCCCWTEDAERDAEAERRRDANEARWERDAVGMAW